MEEQDVSWLDQADLYIQLIKESTSTTKPQRTNEAIIKGLFAIAHELREIRKENS